MNTKAEKILFCIYYIPSISFLGTSSTFDIFSVLMSGALLSIILTLITLLIYDKLSGDDSASTDSNLEKKITFLQKKTQERKFRNRKANGGRSPWILVWIFGMPAGWLIMVLFSANPIVAIILGIIIVYLIGNIIINKS